MKAIVVPADVFVDLVTRKLGNYSAELEMQEWLDRPKSHEFVLTSTSLAKLFFVYHMSALVSMVNQMAHRHRYCLQEKRKNRYYCRLQHPRWVQGDLGASKNLTLFCMFLENEDCK